MAGRNQFNSKDFIKAIPGTGGVIASIARKVGCDWHTAKKYVTEFPSVAQVYQDECATIDDLAVSTVLKAIQEGDVPTAKWWLAKKRRAEFGDSVDLTTGGERIIVRLVGDDEPGE